MSFFVGQDGKVIGRRVAGVVASTAAAVALGVYAYLGPVANEWPTEFAAAAHTRASARLSWKQRVGMGVWPVQYHQIRVQDLTPPAPPGCQNWSKDGGIAHMHYRQCIHAYDGGAGCYVNDGGVTLACNYVPDGGLLAHVTVPDGGLNWDASTPICWCNLDGGFLDERIPIGATWPDAGAMKTCAGQSNAKCFQLTPCPVPGAACQ